MPIGAPLDLDTAIAHYQRAIGGKTRQGLLAAQYQFAVAPPDSDALAIYRIAYRRRERGRKILIGSPCRPTFDFCIRLVEHLIAKRGALISEPAQRDILFGRLPFFTAMLEHAGDQQTRDSVRGLDFFQLYLLSEIGADSGPVGVEDAIHTEAEVDRDHLG